MPRASRASAISALQALWGGDLPIPCSITIFRGPIGSTITRSASSASLGGFSPTIPPSRQLSGSTYLIGYWQSYRYFEDTAEQIWHEVRRAHPPSNENGTWLSRIEACNSVCLHVRRGDYLGGKANSPAVCGPSYYRDAMQHVVRFLTGPKLFVFSDDIPWCRSAFAGADVAFVDVNGPDDAVDDLPSDDGLPASHHRQFVAQLVGRVARAASGAGCDRSTAVAAQSGFGPRPASTALDQTPEGLRAPRRPSQAAQVIKWANRCCWIVGGNSDSGVLGSAATLRSYAVSVISSSSSAWAEPKQT